MAVTIHYLLIALSRHKHKNENASSVWKPQILAKRFIQFIGLALGDTADDDRGTGAADFEADTPSNCSTQYLGKLRGYQSRFVLDRYNGVVSLSLRSPVRASSRGLIVVVDAMNLEVGSATIHCRC